MRTYRAFLVNKRGKVTQPPHELHCTDDDEAVREARQFVDGCNVELSDRERFIAFIGPNGVKVRH